MIAIQTDSENDLAYIALSRRALRRGGVARSKRVDENVTLDFDVDGILLGVEVMNARAVLGKDHRDIRVDEIVGVKEAAALVGVRAPNFVRDYAGKPGFPRPPLAEVADRRVHTHTPSAQARVVTTLVQHGGEPKSVAFHEIGLDYVSCSPFRVPIARLAAAHAALATEDGAERDR